MKSRRSFIRTAAGAIVGFLGLSTANGVFGQTRNPRTAGRVTEFIKGPDGRVTIVNEYDTMEEDDPNPEMVTRTG